MTLKNIKKKEKHGAFKLCWFNSYAYPPPCPYLPSSFTPEALARSLEEEAATNLANKVSNYSSCD